jgi:hypothetical protein
MGTTSEDAFESMKPYIPAIKVKIYDEVKGAGVIGLTCDQVEVRLGLLHQTASAIITTMKRERLLDYKGERRPTRTGRGAEVYVVGRDDV